MTLNIIDLAKEYSADRKVCRIFVSRKIEMNALCKIYV